MPLRSKVTQLRKKIGAGTAKKGGFARNVLTVSSGTILSQAIAVAMLPILTRLYEPSAFGLLAAFMMISNIACQFACLGYHNAIVVPKRDTTALSVWMACLLIGIFASILAYVFFTEFGTNVSRLAGNDELANWLWLVPVYVLIFAALESTANWFTRQKKFAEISRTTVINRLTTVSSQTGLAYMSPQTASSGMLIGHVIGSFVAASVILFRGLSSIPRKYWRSIRLGRTLRLLNIYRHFPTYGMISSLVASIVRALPVLLLGYFFSPAIVGFFALANQMVAGQAQLITSAMFRVLFERANRAKHEGNLAELIKRLYTRMCGLLMTPTGLLCIAAPRLTDLILGEGWEQSGTFLRWMSIVVFFMATVGPMHRVFQILGKQKQLAGLQSLSFFASAATLTIGGLYSTANYTIMAYSLVMGALYTVQAAQVFSVSGGIKTDAIKILAFELPRSLPFLLAMALTVYSTDNKLWVAFVFVGLLALFAALRLKQILNSD